MLRSIVLSAVFGALVYAQSAPQPTNDGPNPFQTIEFGLCDSELANHESLNRLIS
jgi:hypothetical protein